MCDPSKEILPGSEQEFNLLETIVKSLPGQAGSNQN